MRKHLAAAATAGAALALAVAVGLGTTSVAAATATWTVTPGGTFETYPGTAHFSYLTDATTGTVFNCEGLNAGGTFRSGSGLTNPVGTIAFGSLVCGGPGGLEFGVTFSNPRMGIRAVKYDASTDIVYGAITHLHATISTDSGGACTGSIDGTGPTTDNGMVRFQYYNTGGELQTRRGGSNLHAYNVTGCGGLINSGDVLTYTGHASIRSPSHLAVNVIASP